LQQVASLCNILLTIVFILNRGSVRAQTGAKNQGGGLIPFAIRRPAQPGAALGGGRETVDENPLPRLVVGHVTTDGQCLMTFIGRLLGCGLRLFHIPVR